MKSRLRFLDGCRINANAGLANEFNLSSYSSTYWFHANCYSPWRPGNRNTTFFMQFKFPVITWKHPKRACGGVYSGGICYRWTASLSS